MLVQMDVRTALTVLCKLQAVECEPDQAIAVAAKGNLMFIASNLDILSGCELRRIGLYGCGDSLYGFCKCWHELMVCG